jgi:8-oxo-dGTP diphosphatase
MKQGAPIYCADIIARYGGPKGPIVLVERLGSIRGLALPGGKQEKDELLSETARREFREETGLALSIEGVLGTYAEGTRDPRGHYVSTVFVGKAIGVQRDESEKTRVLLLEKGEVLERRNEFVLDHFLILTNYFEGTEGGVSWRL